MDRTNDPNRCKSIHEDDFYQCDSYVGHPGDHQSLTYAVKMKYWTNEDALVPA
jgi:hypothetical protein